MGSTRRDLIKTFAALPLLRFSGADPDLILHNGRVYTVQPGNTEAAAIANVRVRMGDGRIESVER